MRNELQSARKLSTKTSVSYVENLWLLKSQCCSEEQRKDRAREHGLCR